MTDRKQCDALIEKFLAGEALSPEEEAMLSRMLEERTGNCGDQLLVDHLLRLEAIDKPHFVQETVHRIQSLHRKRTRPISSPGMTARREPIHEPARPLLTLWKVAAVFLLTLFSVGLISTYLIRTWHGRSTIGRGVYPFLEQADGRVILSHGHKVSLAKEGVILSENTIIQTAKHARVRIHFADHSLLYLDGDTTFRVARLLEGGYLREGRLAEGKVTCKVQHQPPGMHMAIQTPHAKFEVIGTEFSIETSESLSLLNVWQGKVRVTPARRNLFDDSSRMVEAGQVAVAGAANGLSVWSREQLMSVESPQNLPVPLVRDSVIVIGPFKDPENTSAIRSDHNLVKLLSMLRKLGEKVIVTSYSRLRYFDLEEQRLILLFGQKTDFNGGGQSGENSLVSCLDALHRTETPIFCTSPLWAELLGVATRVKTQASARELVIDELSGSHGQRQIRISAGRITLPLINPQYPPKIVARPVGMSGELAAVAVFEKGKSNGGYRLPGRRIYFPIPSSETSALTAEYWALFAELVEETLKRPHLSEDEFQPNLKLER